MHDALKGCASVSFQKGRLNDTTWGCQVVIAIETSIGHRCENFEWPQWEECGVTKEHPGVKVKRHVW